MRARLAQRHAQLLPEVQERLAAHVVRELDRLDGRVEGARDVAERLAIDGRYRTADEIDPALRGRPTQAWLDGDKMMLTALN